MGGKMMKTAIFLATGYEEIEALTVVDMLRRKKVEIDMVSISDDLDTVGSHGIRVRADKLLGDIDFSSYDCLILPGGMPGTRNLEANGYLMSRFDEAYKENKLICAICAAPTVFGRRGYLKGKKACCYPGMEDALEGATVSYEPVCKTDNVITSRGMGTAILFADKILETVADKETADGILKDIVWVG